MGSEFRMDDFRPEGYSNPFNSSVGPGSSDGAQWTVQPQLQTQFPNPALQPQVIMNVPVGVNENRNYEAASSTVRKSDETLRTVAFGFDLFWCAIFALLGFFGITCLVLVFLNDSYFISACLFSFYVVPLFWMVPMTISTWGIKKGKKKNTAAFGICTLLFCNQISGILLLCSTKDD